MDVVQRLPSLQDNLCELKKIWLRKCYICDKSSVTRITMTHVTSKLASLK